MRWKTYKPYSLGASKYVWAEKRGEIRSDPRHIIRAPLKLKLKLSSRGTRLPVRAPARRKLRKHLKEVGVANNRNCLYYGEVSYIMATRIAHGLYPSWQRSGSCIQLQWNWPVSLGAACHSITFLSQTTPVQIRRKEQDWGETNAKEGERWSNQEQTNSCIG
jgi:hypothetical protein